MGHKLSTRHVAIKGHGGAGPFHHPQRGPRRAISINEARARQGLAPIPTRKIDPTLKLRQQREHRSIFHKAIDKLRLRKAA